MNNERAAWEGGKCRVPMWMGGCPAGFCDDEAFGEQLPSAILYRERHYNRPYNCVPYCFGPCCPGHGGPRNDEPRFFYDGLDERGLAMWCCVGPDFENLQESPAGFSINPFEARNKYLAAQAIEARRAETGTGSVEDESAVAESDAPKATLASAAGGIRLEEGMK